MLITQRIDEAENICDKIAVMKNGEIKAFGTPNDLIKEHGEGFIFKLEVQNEEKRELVN